MNISRRHRPSEGTHRGSQPHGHPCSHAIPAPDATMVDLCDKPFGILIGCADGTDARAGRVIALKTRLWHAPYPNIREFSFVRCHHIHPEEHPSFPGFLWIHDGDVVLHLAGHHARPASRALVKINHHCPFCHRREILSYVAGYIFTFVACEAGLPVTISWRFLMILFGLAPWPFAYLP